MLELVKRKCLYACYYQVGGMIGVGGLGIGMKSRQ